MDKRMNPSHQQPSLNPAQGKNEDAEDPDTVATSNRWGRPAMSNAVQLEFKHCSFGKASYRLLVFLHDGYSPSCAGATLGLNL